VKHKTHYWHYYTEITKLTNYEHHSIKFDADVDGVYGCSLYACLSNVSPHITFYFGFWFLAIEH